MVVYAYIDFNRRTLMSDDTKNTLPNDPADADGVNDISDEGVTSQDGSADDGDFVELAKQFGIDLDTVPEDARDAVEVALRTAENAVHSLREEDSLEMDGLKQKAALYDQLVSRGAPPPVQTTPMPTGQSQPTQAVLFSGKDIERAVQADDPEVLADVLTKGVRQAVTELKDELSRSRLEPVEKAVDTMVQMTVMDNKYPDWRKDLPAIRQVLSLNPHYSLQQAYESGVLVPRYTRDKERTLAKLSQSRDKKRSLVKDAPKGTNKGPAKDIPKTYNTDRDAILAAMEQLGLE
jgi:hypothetical protein